MVVFSPPSELDYKFNLAKGYRDNRLSQEVRIIDYLSRE